MSYLTVTQTFLCALALALPLLAADDAQLLAEFQKTKPDVSAVHVIAEQPLLVAVTGKQGKQEMPATWARGELLGVFAHRDGQVVPIAIQTNEEFPTLVWIEEESPDSITLGLADPNYGTLSDSLKIFYDPKSFFPKRIVRFAPVRVERIHEAAGVVTLISSNGKQDFSIHERNGVWHIVTTPAATSVTMTPPFKNTAPVPAMPVSTIAQFGKARPEKAKRIPPESPLQVEEKVGPYEAVGNKIWVGKTFYDAEGSVGVGDVGYYDETTQNWVFLHIPEMADWSTSALLVEPEAVYVGLVHHGDGTPESGGLLRYNRVTHKTTRTPLPDVIDKIMPFRNRVYCGTSRGFAIVESGRVRRFTILPRLDGSWSITPVT